MVRQLGQTPYGQTFEAMRAFTHSRTSTTQDEVWLTEHDPVFTQGQAGQAEHVLNPGSIPVIQSDRGGQVTYHGPGQITLYLLLDLRRLGIGVKALVTGIEESIGRTLQHYGLSSHLLPGAPGVYVQHSKIAALGLRVSRGRCYHGLSLNVDMDLEPFSRINPCGLTDVGVTQLSDWVDAPIAHVQQRLLTQVMQQFGLHPHTPDSAPSD